MKKAAQFLRSSLCSLRCSSALECRQMKWETKIQDPERRDAETFLLQGCDGDASGEHSFRCA
jgi:hypothetical protein